MDEDELIERVNDVLPEIGRRMYALVAEHPKVAGRPLGQIKAMLYLYRRGHCTVGEIATKVGVSMPAASELIDRLVDDGFMAREINPADRRQVLVQLTPEAQAYGAEIYALRRAQIRVTLDRLPPEERAGFVRGLTVFADVLGEHPSQWKPTSAPAG
ncbi:MAG: MarR family transcriptional regulator [Actinomycetota bacterium]|nr:MarR family transcriptional regulator [Actinomycetota bacterium]